MVASFLLWAPPSACLRVLFREQLESKAVFTSQDTTLALQTRCKMSPEQGWLTGAARTPRMTKVGNVFILHFSLIFISVRLNQISAAKINSRVDYGLEIF